LRGSPKSGKCKAHKQKKKQETPTGGPNEGMGEELFLRDNKLGEKNRQAIVLP